MPVRDSKAPHSGALLEAAGIEPAEDSRRGGSPAEPCLADVTLAWPSRREAPAGPVLPAIGVQ
jgi:hypothetical protein